MLSPAVPVLRPAALGVVLCLAAGVASAAGSDVDPFAGLEFRNVGPVNMSGRVADVEGVPGDPRVVWVGSASGGVWKTDDGGITFRPVFDDQPVASVGDLALAPGNPDVVYVGTGESNVRNSVSFGNGVYRTTDGGQTWRHLGLEKTRHISRVLVHPRDPDTVWVGALGNIYAPSEERGVFRSRDGGVTWQKVLYLDEHHGVSDMDVDPANPKVLYAALWRFERKPWTHRSGSREGGVWRSVDGGDTWQQLTRGLPDLLGRIGVKVAPSDPRVVYVIAESDEGTLFRSSDRGDSFEKVSDEAGIVSRGLYYTDMRVDPGDANRVYAVSSLLQLSIDGGRSFERISPGTHIDFHSLWIDPLDPDRMWQGQDGGVAVSYNRGATWEPIRNLPLAQFYQVFHDDRRPFYVVGGGLQDNGTWYGPSRTREPAGILPDDWRMMSFGDAYWVVPHPDQPEVFISESQGGGILRTDMRTRQQLDINPQARRNDGGPVDELEFRFNWNSPIVGSPQGGETVFFAGNVVFRTDDFGDSWTQISPDLTTDDAEKQQEAGGPVWKENTTAEWHTTIISLAPSPVDPQVIWAGTDDGNLQLTRDAGGTWTNLIGNVRGIPAFSPVSHIEASRDDPGTAWAAFDRHMFDDYRGQVFKTTDFGATWRPASDGLPEEGWVWALLQDPRNHDLLYAGTEVGLYASWNGGARWQKLHLGNLPTVAVHDIRVQPRTDDLILGTHGRALWIFDDLTPIQRWGDVDPEAPHLFETRPGLRHPVRFTRYGLGDKVYTAPNPPYGALITYYLPESLEPAPEAAAGSGDAVEEPGEAGSDTDDGARDGGPQEERIRIEILDASGTVVRRLSEVGKARGLNRVAWDLAYDPPRPRREARGGGGGGAFFQPPRGPEALPGTYTVRLSTGDVVLETPVEVELDPLLEVSPEALRAQFEAASELRALTSAVNDALVRLDAASDELEARQGMVKRLKRELPASLRGTLKARGEELDALLKRLARDPSRPRWSLGPRLSEQLSSLFSDLDTAFAAPSAAQRAFLRELAEETAKALADVNAWLGSLPALNEELAAAGVPGLTLHEPVGL